jgi:hypothetical protein
MPATLKGVSNVRGKWQSPRGRASTSQARRSIHCASSTSRRSGPRAASVVISSSALRPTRCGGTPEDRRDAVIDREPRREAMAIGLLRPGACPRCAIRARLHVGQPRTRISGHAQRRAAGERVLRTSGCHPKGLVDCLMGPPGRQREISAVRCFAVGCAALLSARAYPVIRGANSLIKFTGPFALSVIQNPVIRGHPLACQHI